MAAGKVLSLSHQQNNNFPHQPANLYNNKQQQQITSSSCRTERLDDIFYEPTYDYSGSRDHYKRVTRAFNSAPVTRLISSAVEHFSAIPERYPPIEGIARNLHFLPRNVHMGFPQQLHVTTLTEPWDVSGRNRYKYEHRPLVPYTPGGSERALAHLVDEICQFNSKEVLLGDVTSHRTTGCQTDYRENEAQTEPYSPPVQVIDVAHAHTLSGENATSTQNVPEVLRLAHMTLANHWLPVDINAVEFVERMRRKQAWEQTLPALTDLEQLPRRLRMMENMEHDEWQYREQRFGKLQKIQRIAIEAMKARVREYEERINAKRLKMVWKEKLESLNRTKTDITRQLARDMRKIMEIFKQRKLKWKPKQAAASGKSSTSSKKDIVRDYINYGSHIYAPLLRHGTIRAHVPKRFAAGDCMSDYDHIVQFEKKLHMLVLDKVITVPAPHRSLLGGGDGDHAKKKTGAAGALDQFVRREYRHDQTLARVRVDIEAQRQALADSKIKREPLRLKERIERVEVRPRTPVKCPHAQQYSRHDEMLELAVIFLQKIIRGRVGQNQMYEGIAKRRELLAEIRTTHALQAAEKEAKEEQRVKVLNEQLADEYLHMQEKYIEQGIQQLEGDALSVFMEFLNKELLRVREERRLHAFAWLAQRQRRLREIQETGRRQVELRRRQEEEEIFRQMSQVHHDTLDEYLSAVVARSETNVAHELATQQIMEKAQQLSEALDLAKRKRKRPATFDADDEDSEEVSATRGLITKIIYDFMLPATNRRLQQAEIDAKLEARLTAARETVTEAMRIVAATPPRSGGDDAGVDIPITHATQPDNVASA